jgi:SAM-dependent methyltransferase
MSPTADQVRSDFDLIAALDDRAGNSEHYQRFLLRNLPTPCDTVVEVGCGTGTLARRARRVVALDFSPVMIATARRRAGAHPNIEFQLADIRDWSAPRASLDCVVSVAALHYIDHEQFLKSVRDWLRPGGRLLVLDLLRDDGWADRLRGAVALPVSLALRLLRTGRVRQPPALRQAWRSHGRADRYLSFGEAAQLYPAYLPGAQVCRHLLWRYSVIWAKPMTLADDCRTQCCT